MFFFSLLGRRFLHWAANAPAGYRFASVLVINRAVFHVYVLCLCVRSIATRRGRWKRRRARRLFAPRLFSEIAQDGEVKRGSR